MDTSNGRARRPDSPDRVGAVDTDGMHKDELPRTCYFQTQRLNVGEWHNTPLPAGDTLEAFLSRLLTSTTTRSLPTSWQGDYDQARAAAWIRERDKESPTMMVTDRSSGTPIGLMMLFEIPCGNTSERLDLRLGYVLDEPAWGRGLGTELITGLVEWCRSQPHIRSIAGGVGIDNPASARVLTKNGFTPAGEVTDSEQLFELVLINDDQC